MGGFLKGILVGFVGFLAWVVASLIEGVIRGASGEGTGLIVLVYVGFLLMVGGPAYYWLVAPIIGLIRRRRGRDKPPVSTRP